MNHKQVARFALIIALIWMTASVTAKAQSAFVTGLKAPVKIVVIGGGNLLVAEAGNGPNAGRVSLIDRCGNRLTLLDALPSGLSAPNNEPDGPTAVALVGRTLYVLTGEGDSLRNGPAPGTTIANPNPSSPLFSAALAVEFSAEVGGSTGGFTLAAADHATIKNGTSVTLSNGRGQIIRVPSADFFDVCLQDDRTGETLRFNSATGDYSFASCSSGFTLTGRARVEREGCFVTLRDARVSATLERCVIAPRNRGSTTIRRTPFGSVFLINDSDTTNNTCTGGGGSQSVSFLFRTRAVTGSDGEFIAVTTNPELIGKVHAQLALPAEQRRQHINGPIARGNGGHNQNWSWHFTPDGWNLVETSIELCDGTPRLVENDIAYWVDRVGRFCPW
jgi:hypothetical protein